MNIGAIIYDESNRCQSIKKTVGNHLVPTVQYFLITFFTLPKTHKS